MYWGGGAAVSVTLTTPHVLIGTQEIVLDWDKKTGVLVPCRRGAEVSRGQQTRTPEDVRRPFRSGGKMRSAESGS